MKIDRQKVDKLMLKRGIVEYKELARRARMTPKHLSDVLCRGTCPPRTAVLIADGLGVTAPAITVQEMPAINWRPPTPEEFMRDCQEKGLPVPMLGPEAITDPAIERIKAQAFATTPDPIWETSPMEMEHTVLEFISKPIPEAWRYYDLSARLAFWRDRSHTKAENLVPRDRICAAEVWAEALNRSIEGMRRKDVQKINAIIAEAPGWEKAEKPLRFGPFGFCRGFVKCNVAL